MPSPLCLESAVSFGSLFSPRFPTVMFCAQCTQLRTCAQLRVVQQYGTRPQGREDATFTPVINENSQRILASSEHYSDQVLLAVPAHVYFRIGEAKPKRRRSRTALVRVL